MQQPTFRTWLERRHRQPGPIVPEVDKIMRWIITAGQRGIRYGELLASTELERDVVDRLLAGLYDLGMVSVSGSGVGRVYRYCCRL